MVHKRIGFVHLKPNPVFVTRNANTDPDEPYYVSTTYDEVTRQRHTGGGDTIEEAVDALTERLNA